MNCMTTYLIAGVFNGFDESAGVTGKAKKEKEKTTAVAVAEENIWRVEDYFTNNVKTSIRTAADDLNLTFSTVWLILRK